MCSCNFPLGSSSSGGDPHQPQCYLEPLLYLSETLHFLFGNVDLLQEIMTGYE